MYPETSCRVSEDSSVRNKCILVPQYYSGATTACEREQFLTIGFDNPLSKDMLLVKTELSSM